jgi:hypothetical protein
MTCPEQDGISSSALNEMGLDLLKANFLCACCIMHPVRRARFENAGHGMEYAAFRAPL